MKGGVRAIGPWLVLIALSLLATGCPQQDPQPSNGKQGGVPRSHAQEERAEMARAPQRFPPGKPDLTRGKAVYDKHCITCHGPNGRGDGPAARRLDPKPADLTNRDFIARHAPSEFVQSIADGLRTMPGFKKALTAQEIWDVYYFMRGFPVPPDALTKGKALYESTCMACHGDKADGKGPSGVGLTPGPADLTDPRFMSLLDDKHLIKAITNGEYAMPAFGSRLSTQEIRDILDYERSFSYTGKQ